MSKDEAFIYELGRITFLESLFYARFTKLFVKKAERRWKMYQRYVEMSGGVELKRIKIKP